MSIWILEISKALGKGYTWFTDTDGDSGAEIEKSNWINEYHTEETED